MSVETELGHQAAQLRLVHEDRSTRELKRRDASQHQIAQGDPGCGTARQPETAEPRAVAVEDLNALSALWGIGHGEPSVWPEVERARAEDMTILWANLDELYRFAGVTDSVDAVRLAVEHVVVTVSRLLEASWFAELSDYVCREAAGRP